MEHNRSAIWGGATFGLVVGLIAGFFVGNYWTTVLIAVIAGAAIGVAAHLLSLLGNTGRRGRRQTLDPALVDSFASFQLPVVEQLLREHVPADFEASPNAAVECVDVVQSVEEQGWWRAGYDSLDSFYAAHEPLHPDIRVYAAVRREIPTVDPLEPPEGIGRTIVEKIAEHRA